MVKEKRRNSQLNEGGTKCCVRTMAVLVVEGNMRLDSIGQAPFYYCPQQQQST